MILVDENTGNRVKTSIMVSDEELELIKAVCRQDGGF